MALCGTLRYPDGDCGKEGIHARPAGLVVAEAKKFAGAVTIENKGKTADLKRIIAVMALCVKSGEEVIVRVDGEGEAPKSHRGCSMIWTRQV